MHNMVTIVNDTVLHSLKVTRRTYLKNSQKQNKTPHKALPNRRVGRIGFQVGQ